VFEALQLFDRHVFLDIETTGLNPGVDEVIELGAAFVERGELVREEHWLVRPAHPVPAIITALTGLTDAELLGAASFDELAPTFTRLFQGHTVVAHNAIFEQGFLGPVLDGRPVLDSCELALLLFPELRSHSLDALLKWAGLPDGARHRALDDALDTWKVVQVMLQRAATPGRQRALERLAQRLPASAPTRAIVAGLARLQPVEAKAPTTNPAAGDELPEPLERWASQPFNLALEFERRNHERLVADAAARVHGAVWVASPASRLTNFHDLPRLPSSAGCAVPERVKAMVGRQVIDPDLSSALGYLETWAERGSKEASTLSGFWRDRLPIIDTLRTLLRGRDTAVPSAQGVSVGTFQDVADWLEAGVRPAAVVWLDAPSLADTARRRMTKTLEVNRVLKLPELCELAAPGRPMTPALTALHSRARDLAQRLSVFAGPTRLEQVNHGLSTLDTPHGRTPWPALREALSGLSHELADWRSELRAVEASPSRQTHPALLEGVHEEASRLAALVQELLSPAEGSELWVAPGVLWVKPASAAVLESLAAMTRAAPGLFVSDVRRPEGWPGRLGLQALERVGQARATRPISVAAGLSDLSAVVSLALSHPGALTILSAEPLTEDVVAAFVARGAQAGRRVRLNRAGAGPRDVVLKEWAGAGPVPELHGAPVLLFPREPLCVRRVAVESEGEGPLMVISRLPLEPPAMAAALEGLTWHEAALTSVAVSPARAADAGR